jgi:ABC-type branched-subunit amino acid transport system substrate-binding protein
LNRAGPARSCIPFNPARPHGLLCHQLSQRARIVERANSKAAKGIGRVTMPAKIDRFRRNKTMLGVASCVSLMMLAATACSGKSGSSGSDDSSVSAPTGSVVKIGIVAPEGTAVLNVPESVTSVYAAVDALNARGGLNGHKVEVDYCNDKGDPNQAAACGRQMVTDKVIAVVGGASSNPTILPPILQAANIPWLGDNAQSAPEMNTPIMFLFSGGSAGGFAAMSARDGKIGVAASLIVSDVPTVTSLITLFSTPAKTAGTPFVEIAKLPPTAADAAPTVAAAKVDKVKTVLVALSPPQVAQVIRATQASGANPIFEWSGEPQADIIPALGSTGVMDYATPFSGLVKDSSNALVKRYLKELKTRAATGDKDAATAGDYPSGRGIQGWLGVYVIEKLVKSGAIKDLTSDSVLAALVAAKDIDMEGVIPPWTPNLEGPANQVRISNQYYFMNRLVNGKVTQLTPKAVTVAGLLDGTFAAPKI